MLTMSLYLQGQGSALQEAVYALNKHPVYSTISSLVRIHWPRNKSIEMRVAPFSVTPSVPPAKFSLAKSLLPVPTTLGSADLEDLIPQRGMLLLKDTTIKLLDGNLRLSPTHFVVLTPLNQQLNKEVTVLTEMIHINCQGEIATTKWKYGRVCLAHRKSLRICFTRSCD